MKYITRIGDFMIYEWTRNECKRYFRPFPTFACWSRKDPLSIGYTALTENETATLSDMVEWCYSNSDDVDPEDDPFSEKLRR